ncbi:hypothetical protein SDJN02_06163, partial [Cucurbita argyrosperma subsp. argyrosperma]
MEKGKVMQKRRLFQSRETAAIGGNHRACREDNLVDGFCH